VAVFPEEAGAWRPAGGELPPPRAVLAKPGHVVLDVPAGGQRLLASSIVWSKGWSARSGGRRLPILKVDGAFLGVRLPTGAARVELRFLPPGLIAGCALFAVSFAVLLALFFLPLSPIGKRAQG
jgi:hypothetical protein